MQQEFLLTAILWTAMALLAGAALVLSYLLWKAQRVDPHQKAPHQKAQRVDPPLLG